MTERLNRRTLLTGAASAAAGATLAGHARAQDALPEPNRTDQLSSATPADAGTLEPIFFFNDEEVRFMAAAVDRLIPPDETFTGASGAGVVSYIDRQLASEWGAGARMYLRGPWFADAPAEQGYQLRHPPAEVYRIGIAETRAHVLDTYGGRAFEDLIGEMMDEVLHGLEAGTIALPSLPAPVFFETLLANTIEGYFSDPAYGGNRNMVGWRLVGFPGAYASYVDLVDQYDVAYTREPLSFADTEARTAHLAGGQHGGQQ